MEERTGLSNEESSEGLVERLREKGYTECEVQSFLESYRNCEVEKARENMKWRVENLEDKLCREKNIGKRLSAY